MGVSHVMQEDLEELGIDPDHTPVDTFMQQPLGVALELAHRMEHGDDACEE